jgi:DNA-binding GntR family transcriptional regulator
MSDADALSAGVDSFSTTTRSLLVQRLRDEILSGGMPHGTRLRQVEVAARFGISPTPVREAFRELATLGLVEIQAHRGAVVVQLSDDDLAQIYEVRTIVEPMCVAWSAQRITPEVLREARELLDAMRERQPPEVAVALNRRFHVAIASACGNDDLAEVVVRLLDRSTPYITRVLESTPERFERQLHEHEQLLHALERRDPVAAYKASLDHLTHLHPEDSAATAALSAISRTRWLPFDIGQWLLGGTGSDPLAGGPDGH